MFYYWNISIPANNWSWMMWHLYFFMLRTSPCLSLIRVVVQFTNWYYLKLYYINVFCMVKTEFIYYTHLWNNYLKYCSRFLTQCFLSGLVDCCHIRMTWNKMSFSLYKGSLGSLNLWPWVLPWIHSFLLQEGMPQHFLGSCVLIHLLPFWICLKPKI